MQSKNGAQLGQLGLPSEPEAFLQLVNPRYTGVRHRNTFDVLPTTECLPLAIKIEFAQFVGVTFKVKSQSNSSVS